MVVVRVRSNFTNKPFHYAKRRSELCVVVLGCVLSCGELYTSSWKAYIALNKCQRITNNRGKLLIIDYYLHPSFGYSRKFDSFIPIII